MRKTLIKPDTKVFPANYLLLLINFLEQQGYNVQTALKEIQLPQYVNEDPEQFVSYGFLKIF